MLRKNLSHSPVKECRCSLREFAPGFGQILSLQNVADSNYNAFQATLRRTAGPIFLSVAYTYSHSIDDSSDRSDATFVNSYDLSANKASSNFDQRNLLNIGYVWQDFFLSLERLASKVFGTPPGSCPSCSEMQDYVQPSSEEHHGFGPHSPQSASDDIGGRHTTSVQDPGSGTHISAGEIVHAIFSSWEFSGITTFQSGQPFSVINGGGSTGISVLDNAGVAIGQGAGSYPDLIGNPNGAAPVGANNTQSFCPALGNAAAFAAPRGLTFGTAGRNSMNNPSRLNFDMSLIKNFRVRSERNLEIRVEAFNVFNHTQFRIYDPNLGNTGSNTVNCYGGASANYSAAGGGGTNCLTGSSFLHPADAHRPRTIQLGAKFAF